MPLTDSLKNIGETDTYPGEVIQQCGQSGSLGKPGGVCATLVSRWIKYQTIGKSEEFWVAKNETGRTPHWVSAIRKSGEKILVPHKDRKDKLLVQHERYKSMRSDETITASAGAMVAFSLAGENPFWKKGPKGVIKNKKLVAASIAAFSYNDSESMRISDTEDIRDFLMERLPRNASAYVSLIPGWQGDRVGHAVGIHHREDGAVRFFDPNLAEIQLKDTKTLAVWWEEAYRESWENSTYDKYLKQGGSIRITVIRGHKNLEALNNELAQRQLDMDEALKEQLAEVERERAKDPDLEFEDPRQFPRDGLRAAMYAANEKKIEVRGEQPNSDVDLSEFDDMLARLNSVNSVNFQ